MHNFSEKNNLVELAVRRLVDVGVRVVNVTCDCTRVNIAMMKNLGANLNPQKIDSQKCYDIGTTNMYIIHDMVHCIKLVRNTWAHHKILRIQNGEVID